MFYKIKRMKKLIISILILICSTPVMGNGLINIQEVHQITELNSNGEDGNIEIGKASFYGGKYHHGKKMANGKRFDKNALTCAHPTHPFGTKLLVTNVKNGKSVTVTVTDRGGFQKLGRIIDLSEGAFKQIASLKTGVITVKIEKL